MRTGRWRHAKKIALKEKIKSLKPVLEVTAYIVSIIAGIVTIFKELF